MGEENNTSRKRQRGVSWQEYEPVVWNEFVSDTRANMFDSPSLEFTINDNIQRLFNNDIFKIFCQVILIDDIPDLSQATKDFLTTRRVIAVCLFNQKILNDKIKQLVNQKFTQKELTEFEIAWKSNLQGKSNFNVLAEGTNHNITSIGKMVKDGLNLAINPFVEEIYVNNGEVIKFTLTDYTSKAYIISGNKGPESNNKTFFRDGANIWWSCEDGVSRYKKLERIDL